MANKLSHLASDQGAASLLSRITVRRMRAGRSVLNRKLLLPYLPIRTDRYEGKPVYWLEEEMEMEYNKKHSRSTTETLNYDVAFSSLEEALQEGAQAPAVGSAELPSGGWAFACRLCFFRSFRHPHAWPSPTCWPTPRSGTEHALPRCAEGQESIGGDSAIHSGHWQTCRKDI